MDQTTQQNAALVEESAAAADSLQTQAQQLVEAMAVFKVDGMNAAAAPVAARAAAIRVTPPRPVKTTARKAAVAPVAQRQLAAPRLTPGARPSNSQASAKSVATSPAPTTRQRETATADNGDWESF
jgi:hypothetical protein